MGGRLVRLLVLCAALAAPSGCDRVLDETGAGAGLSKRGRVEEPARAKRSKAAKKARAKATKRARTATPAKTAKAAKKKPRGAK